MYGLVPYNISDKQKGIQFGHAVVRFGRELTKERSRLLKVYNYWADHCETFIILDGGTTNTNPNRPGTLNRHRRELNSNGVRNCTFYEPDLGDQLTAVVFLVDDRVWDRTAWPDYVVPGHKERGGIPVEEWLATDPAYAKWKRKFSRKPAEADQIVWLRQYLRPLKLA
jgi:hypothetical protein